MLGTYPFVVWYKIGRAEYRLDFRTNAHPKYIDKKLARKLVYDRLIQLNVHPRLTRGGIDSIKVLSIEHWA